MDPFFMSQPVTRRRNAPSATPGKGDARTPNRGTKRTPARTPGSARSAKSTKRTPRSTRDAAESDADVSSDSSGGAGRRRRGYGSDDGSVSSERSEGAVPGETADERRVRLARRFLDKVERAEEAAGDRAEGSDEDDVDARVARRLREDALDRTGSLVRERADGIAALGDGLADMSNYTRFNGHSLSLTCVALSSDDTFAITGGKDCRLVRHDLETGARFVFPGGRRQNMRKPVVRHPRKLPGGDVTEGHLGHVLCAAITEDGRMLASGGADSLIRVWDLRTNTMIDAFRGHRGPVSGLSFRRGTSILYSASHDRTVKAWNCDEMGYMESLFGHQSEVLCLDAMSRERCVTGGFDHSARMWKVPEETHLVFRAGEASVDAVSMMTESTFVTGSASGAVDFWSVTKKKPTARTFHAPRAQVSSVAALRFSDVVASGADDGWLRFHRVNERAHKLTEVNRAAVPGFVNGIAFSSERNSFVLAAAGQEHRAGRWSRDRTARNAMYLIPLGENGN